MDELQRSALVNQGLIITDVWFITDYDPNKNKRTLSTQVPLEHEESVIHWDRIEMMVRKCPRGSLAGPATDVLPLLSPMWGV